MKFNKLYWYIFQILQMIESYMKNAVEYSLQELKCISGSIPKNIQGRYIRNGAGTFHYGNDVLSHLFTGDGVILKVEFREGKCWSELKFANTHFRKAR